MTAGPSDRNANPPGAGKPAPAPAAAKALAAAGAVAGGVFGAAVYPPLTRAIREWTDPRHQYFNDAAWMIALALVGLAVVGVGLPVMQAVGRLGLVRPGNGGGNPMEWGSVGEWLAAWLIGAPLLGGLTALVAAGVVGLVAADLAPRAGGTPPLTETVAGLVQGAFVGGVVGLYGSRPPRIRVQKKSPPW